MFCIFVRELKIEVWFQLQKLHDVTKKNLKFTFVCQHFELFCTLHRFGAGYKIRKLIQGQCSAQLLKRKGPRAHWLQKMGANFVKYM